MSALSRVILVALVSGALATVGALGAAQAAPDVYGSGAVIKELPARATLTGNQTPAQSVTVTLPVPTGVPCATGLTTRVVGQRDAVTVSAVDCTVAGSASWTVTAAARATKRHAVVKFIATNPTDSSKTVKTLGVTVNAGARPAKPNKPGKPSPSPSPSVGASS